MSDVQRLKEQLHQLSTEAKQASGGLEGFKLKFVQHGQLVENLIAGTATGADQAIAQVLEIATKAVEQAVEALETAALECKTYADQI